MTDWNITSLSLTLDVRKEENSLSLLTVIGVSRALGSAELRIFQHKYKSEIIKERDFWKVEIWAVPGLGAAYQLLFKLADKTHNVCVAWPLININESRCLVQSTTESNTQTMTVTGIITRRMPSLAERHGKPENLPHSTGRVGTRLNRQFLKVYRK